MSGPVGLKGAKGSHDAIRYHEEEECTENDKPGGEVALGVDIFRFGFRRVSRWTCCAWIRRKYIQGNYGRRPRFFIFRGCGRDRTRQDGRLLDVVGHDVVMLWILFKEYMLPTPTERAHHNDIQSDEIGRKDRELASENTSG